MSDEVLHAPACTEPRQSCAWDAGAPICGCNCHVAGPDPAFPLDGIDHRGLLPFTGVTVLRDQPTGDGRADQRPHGRGCGWRSHPHGPLCGADCPTCLTSPLGAVAAGTVPPWLAPAPDPNEVIERTVAGQVFTGPRHMVDQIKVVHLPRQTARMVVQLDTDAIRPYMALLADLIVALETAVAAGSVMVAEYARDTLTTLRDEHPCLPEIERRS